MSNHTDPFEALNAHPLAATLAAAVPLRIIALLERGGPEQSDFDRAQSFGDELGERGDILLFGGKKGEAAALFNKLAHIVAIMSFVPGGVEMFGQRWVAEQWKKFVNIA